MDTIYPVAMALFAMVPLTVIGKALHDFAPLLVGAAIALKLTARDIAGERHFGLRQQLAAAGASVALGFYLGGAVIEWVGTAPVVNAAGEIIGSTGIDPDGPIAATIKLLAALYGTRAASSVADEIGPAVAALRKRFFGDSNQ